MLQISTGKYFEEEKKRRHNSKFVFYSNIKLPSIINIDSPAIAIEEAEYGDITCYVVSYQLITEEHPVIIKCGDQDLIYQFILVWEFFFDCIASTQKDTVQKICREKKVSSYDKQSASEISPNMVQLGRRVTNDDVQDFLSFFECLMGVNRKAYKSIVAALKIISDAKETILTNFDLAYSTLVYAIESLSQKHDGYTQKWDDFDDDVRRKIDPVLDRVDPEISTSIRNVLIEGKQFKLRKRFESFVDGNLNDKFYRKYLGENTNTLRKSFLSRSLKNLYQLRSSFVHELKPLDVMLSSPHSPSSDYMLRYGEPYLTFSGLNRLARSVIVNFVGKSISSENEKISWTQETSSVITAELSAKCWIHEPAGFNGSTVNKWFSSYIYMLDSKEVTEQSKIMSKIEDIFGSSKKKSKREMFHYYWLYNTIHHGKDEKWKEFILRNEMYFGKCINFYVAILYMNHELSYNTDGGKKHIDLDEFDHFYSEYSETRFHKHNLSLPAFTESAMLCAASNIALSVENMDKYGTYMNLALSESSNNLTNYALIENALNSRGEVDMNKYFRVESNCGE